PNSVDFEPSSRGWQRHGELAGATGGRAVWQQGTLPATGPRPGESGWSVPGQVAVDGDGGEQRGAGWDGGAEGRAVDEGIGDRGVERAGVGGCREVPGDGGGGDGLPGGLGIAGWRARRLA